MSKDSLIDFREQENTKGKFFKRYRVDIFDNKL